MAVNNVWVFAQEANGAPTTGTLELITKARSLGTVTAFVGGDASAIAGALGEHGAAKVYATGDLGGKLPGVAVAAAMKAASRRPVSRCTSPNSSATLIMWSRMLVTWKPNGSGPQTARSIA